MRRRPRTNKRSRDFKAGTIPYIFICRSLNRTFATIMERPPSPTVENGKEPQREVVDNLRKVVVLLSRIDSNSAALAARTSPSKQYKERLDDLRMKRR